MIELVFTDMCKNCLHAELELIKMDMADGSVFWEVICDHAIACKRMQRIAKRESDGEKE